MMFHTFEVRIVQAIEKRSPGWLPNYPLYRYLFFFILKGDTLYKASFLVSI